MNFLPATSFDATALQFKQLFDMVALDVYVAVARSGRKLDPVEESVVSFCFCVFCVLACDDR
jgi:hypothetical protein